MAAPSVSDVLEQLAELDDPKIRAVNARHGDDHGVNLTKLRAVAKGVKAYPELAQQLWSVDDSAAKLVAILISKPRQYDAATLDGMVRETKTPKVHDWFVNYIVKKSPHAEELRVRWLADPDPVVASAGWALTSERIAKNPAGIDVPQFLHVIETQMQDAPDRLQWEMNTCLAYIGIELPEFREQALKIGHQLEVLKDYPTAPNCTSPYAPVWIEEMVKRNGK